MMQQTIADLENHLDTTKREARHDIDRLQASLDEIIIKVNFRLF